MSFSFRSTNRLSSSATSQAMAGGIFIAALACFATTALADGSSVDCKYKGGTGPTVDVQQRCNFFVQYQPDSQKPDERIVKNLGLKPGDFARSIALVVGISQYDNSAYNLPAARTDVEALKSFLVNNQQFDEVIVLENKDATIDNIRYFLRDYALQRTNYYQGKVRFLFAYSGHGIQVQFFGDSAQPASQTPSVGLALAAAANDQDYQNIYGLNELRALFNDLAKNTYHFLALINACYGGDVFVDALTGGSDNDPTGRSAYAVTAGPNDTVVYSVATDQGSLFFHALIEGIETGDADIPAQRATLKMMGSDPDLYGIVRLGELDGYLTGQIKKELEANQFTAQDAPGNLHHWTGSVEPFDVRAMGGFFFLQNPPKTTAATQFNVALQPVSAILAPSLNQFHNPGQVTLPSVAAVTAPAGVVKKLSAIESSVQPILGVDVSHFNGRIDWTKVAKQNIHLAYIKATQSSAFKDPDFARNWDAAREAGVLRGAYHTYSFCADPEKQLEALLQVVKPGASALPVAVDAELSRDQEQSNISSISAEGKCATSIGIDGVRARLNTLLASIEKVYGKKPIIYGNDYFLDKVLTAAFTQKFLLWRARYGLAFAAPPSPWVLWQYTQNGAIDGIKGSVDVNVVGSNLDIRDYR